jgi:hypothetical protein
MQYRAGTVALAGNSSIVRGNGTAWAGQVEPGAMFARSGDRVSYTVAAVNNDTELMLSAPYQGEASESAFYWITTSFTPNRGYPVAEPGDIDAIQVFSRAIQEIDADIPATGGGVRVLDDLQDVVAGAPSVGHVLTRQADGTWGPSAPGAASVDGANVGTGGGAVFKQKAGATLEFRRIKVTGGATLNENADDVTISVPPAGEANTASNAGTASSVGVFAGKTGTNLAFRGIRAGSGVTVTQDVNDIVVSSTGGGSTGGEANTASNLGVGTVQPFRQKVGADLQFRTVSFEAARFATSISGDGNTYTVTFRPLAFTEIGGVSVGGAATGQYLRRNADGTWSGATLPATGIASVSADPAPSLGGNLDTVGRRIVGLPGVVPGLIERPAAKTYVLCLQIPQPIAIASARARTAAGTVGWRVLVNGLTLGVDPEGNGGLTGTAGTTAADVVVPTVATTPQGYELAVALFAPSADCADFCFAIHYRTA